MFKFRRAGSLLAIPFAALSMFTAGCAEADPTAPFEGGSPPLQAAAAQVTGETGPGAQYGFYVPENWNGSLVLYVHGFRDASQPISLDNGNQDNMLALRDGLTAQGYAVGWSSFSENGWAVRDGAIRTHQLNGLFESRFGRPARTYLVGHSLGALIATSLVESHPATYAGVMPVCGILGGAQTTVNYIGNIRLLFDFFYPGVLPGSVVDPAGATLAQVVGPAQAALVGNLSGAFGIAAAMSAIGMPLSLAGATPAEQVPSLVGTIVYALAFHVRGFDDLTSRTHGRAAFDNWDTNYVIPAVQNGVPRYRARSDALAYLAQWYQPSGRLQVPMLTLDPMFDPIAPLFHKDAYHAAVSAAGASDLLARRVVPTFGHCNVPVDVTLARFGELVSWVETGTRP